MRRANPSGRKTASTPKLDFRTGSFKATNRKALQLCREVARTLGHALAWEMGDEVLSGLDVVAVDPAPGFDAVVRHRREVMRAQRELTRIVRKLRPMVAYKGT